MKIQMMAIGVAIVGVTLFAGCGGGDDKDSAKAADRGSTGGTPAPVAAKLPADPCALLTTEEVQALAPTAAKGVKNEAGPADCDWTGTDSNALHLKVAMLPGTAADYKYQLQTEARDPKVTGSEISGIGDFAVYISPSADDAGVKAIAGPFSLTIAYNGGTGARAEKAKIVTVAEQAAKRLK